MAHLSRFLFSFAGGVLGLVKRQTPLFIGTAIMALGVIAGAVALANFMLDQRIEDASASLKNLAYVVSDEANRSMQAIDLSVSKVAERLQSHKLRGVAALDEVADSPEIRSMLDDIVADNPFLDSVFVIGADGKVDLRSRGGVIPAELIVGSDYMAALKHIAPNGFYVSSPFQTYRFRSWMVNFSRRVSSPDGAFLGAVAGIVKLSSFSDVFDKIDLRSQGTISLFSSDGDLISWAPQARMPFGSSVVGSPIYTDFIEPQQDGVIKIRLGDKVERLLAIAHSPDFPVTVVVGMGMSDVIADWIPQARSVALAAGLVILAIFAFALRLGYRQEQYHAERERRALERQMAEHAVELSNAIENILQGLAMFDSDGSLVMHNGRFAKIYGLPEEKLTDGRAPLPLAELGLGDTFGQPFGRTIHEPDGSTLTHHRLRDGRIIAQRKKLLEEGGWVTTHEDITAKQEADDKIREMASHDALTGLVNRFEFKLQLGARIADARRYGFKLAAFYLDLDGFKLVNDTLGHIAGDSLLKQAAERIRRCVRETDVVARLGGDEFALIQRVDVAPRDPMALAERLLAAIAQPFLIDGKTIDISVSIGISVMPNDGHDTDELIRAADLALFYAKQEGGGVYRFFTPGMDEAVQARRALEADLRRAIVDQQFELYLQPVVSVADRVVKSFEALIRWNHPERGFISPADFIPAAEDTGLIVQIGDWVLREACRKAAALPRDIRVAVNVSAAQLRSAGFLDGLRQALDEAGITASKLVIEITESVLIKDVEPAIATLHAIRELGAKIAMDDFGTGYSSLSYLRKFPFDKVKIDKSFVGGLGEDSSGETIVRAAIALARELGMVSVAEGIETEQQMAFLAEAGCAEAQGYLFSRPMPWADVGRFLGVTLDDAPAPKKRPVAEPEPPVVAEVKPKAPLPALSTMRHIQGRRGQVYAAAGERLKGR